MSKAAEGIFGIDHANAIEGPAQGAVFEIEVDEDDGCAWIVAGGQTINLGPVNAVAEKWAQWLADREFES